MRVQYGCGLSAPSGWRNFDASPTLRIQRVPLIGTLITKGKTQFPSTVEYGDVTNRLPVATGSCEAVYCSHVLEHLALNEFRRALLETYRISAPNAVFRGVLPDLAYYIKRYSITPGPDAAKLFMSDTDLGEEHRARGIKGVMHSVLGNSRHRWMWDFASLQKELEDAGFSEVRRASAGDDFVDVFRAVEDKQRWENCLGFQCRKRD